jgi:hypothetical protein
MKKGLALLLPAALLVALMGVSQVASAGTKDTKGVASAPCINATTGQQEGTFKYDGVTVAWPPNHKERQATVSLTDEDDEPLTDTASITVTGTHDQISENGQEFVGSGNTDLLTDVLPGAGTGTPTAAAVFFFRGERSGTEQDGRTYTFTANGTTDNGMSTCEPVEFTAYVPHDQGN